MPQTLELTFRDPQGEPVHVHIMVDGSQAATILKWAAINGMSLIGVGYRS